MVNQRLLASHRPIYMYSQSICVHVLYIFPSRIVILCDLEIPFLPI